MNRYLRTATAGLVMALVGCGDGGPSTGQIEGALGAFPLDGDSEVDRVRKESCTDHDRAIFHFSFGDGAVRIRAVLPWNNIAGMVAWTEGTYAIPPTTASTYVESWEMLAPATPVLTGGEFTVTSEPQPLRKHGRFTLQFDGDLTATADFDVRKGDTTGPMVSCGDGGGDWDD